MIKLDNPILEASIKKIIDQMEKKGILFNEKTLIEIGIFYICNLVMLEKNIKELQFLEAEYLDFMGAYYG